MVDLTTKEILQPSLLDRLTDDEPEVKQEPRSKRVLSVYALRQAVLRDLVWLLNANGLGVTQSLEDTPLAAKSVINYGFHDHSGEIASSFDVARAEHEIFEAIWNFEPRIMRETLRINTLRSERYSHNTVIFEIHGEIWGQYIPEKILLRTEIDFEVGEVKINDLSMTAN